MVVKGRVECGACSQGPAGLRWLVFSLQLLLPIRLRSLLFSVRHGYHRSSSLPTRRVSSSESHLFDLLSLGSSQSPDVCVRHPADGTRTAHVIPSSPRVIFTTPLLYVPAVQFSLGCPHRSRHSAA